MRPCFSPATWFVFHHGKLIALPGSFCAAPCSTTVFSHAQTAVVCANCSVLLCTPTGGKTRLTEGCSFRKKVE